MTTSTRSARLLPVYTLLLAATLWLTGCDFGVSQDDAITARTTDVAVANAGAFGAQNSSFTFINPEEETVSNTDTFASYIQSHILLDNQLLTIFGETGTLGVFDLETQNQLGQVTGIPNPRYVISDGRVAYVTSQSYSDDTDPAVYIINLGEREIVDTITLEANPEGITGTSSSLFVATGNVDGQIIEISRPLGNPITGDHTIARTIDPECDAPRRPYVTSQGLLAVACSGATIYDDDFNVVEETNGALLVIDPAGNSGAGSILDREDLAGQLTSASSQQRTFYSRLRNTLFAVLEDNTVVQYSTLNGNRSDIQIDGPPIGAIAFDAVNEVIYLGRPDPANPFGAAGTVTVHEGSGAQLASYEAGIAPGHIALRITQGEQDG